MVPSVVHDVICPEPDRSFSDSLDVFGVQSLKQNELND